MTCLFSLKEEFPAWYEKLVLEMVHHNTASLEKLVDTAWLEIMTKYAVGEECDFEVSVCFVNHGPPCLLALSPWPG